jgi:hypothetical protein
VSVNASPRLITGQWLAHAKLTLAERAYLAADLFSGVAQLVAPTVVQCALLARVNSTYAHAAIKRPNDRAFVVSGVVPLMVPTVKALPAPASAEQRLVDIVAEQGVNNTLAMLVAIERNGAAL